ncbi:MaoC family dehydratase [Sphingomonas lycopersici]|uniref:MaoC family dehydratase n=1 Tax=Sphingomonas lycopersici TaxID=2951807 RepID=A0AA41ZHB1_9SPHN|nr:MaoC family dehydratase [Sphingomonas lycopersici]MCW6536934.1 MaoC family dehydratase [Sphingomonas lycopersici]
MSAASHTNGLLAVEPGALIGVSNWMTITQAMVDRFAEATLDDDPMHVDPDWARAETPYGGTIAFGFLTMSLLTHMLHCVQPRDRRTEVAVAGYYLNYGFNRLRLISPVPTGSAVRGRFELIDRREDERGRAQLTIGATVEIEHAEKPALVAEWLSIWVPPAGLQEA